MFSRQLSKYILSALIVFTVTPLLAAESLLNKSPDYSLVPKMRLQFEPDKSRGYTGYQDHYDKYGFFGGQELENVSMGPAEKDYLDQIDATFYFPLGRKGMSFDLGLNMKYIYGQSSSYEQGRPYARSFSATIPMISASALFDLPFKGLSAGFEGKRYVEVENAGHRGFDYQARISYEWDQGFGLRGGWQHQQYSLDNADQTTTDIEQKGPFLDFYLRF